MTKEAIVLPKGEGETLGIMGTKVTFLCPADKTAKGFSLMEVILPKDAGPPPHDHPWDEAYYIVEGETRFEIDGRAVTARAGDFLYAPGGTVHGFMGASDSPARVLVFDAPAAAEAFFRDVDREVKRLPEDMGKVPEIGRRHRLNFRVQ